MPTFSRQYLRRQLGLVHVRDTYVGTVDASWGYAPYSLNIVDSGVADLSLSGQNAYLGAWVRLEYSGIGWAEARVASFNVASGAYVSQDFGRYFGTNVFSGAVYERSTALSGLEKNLALTEAVGRVRFRGEVALPPTADGVRFPLPPGVEVLDAYVFASPDAPDRGRRALGSFETVLTASGPEIRVAPAVGGSAQLVLDALVTPTLGFGDGATLNLPEERLVLYAAEARCWELLVRKAPRGTADEYRRLRDEAARQFSLLASRYKAPVDRPLRLEAGL